MQPLYESEVNLDFRDELMEKIQRLESWGSDAVCGISLRLFIYYDENDDLSNIGSGILMDLDPHNHWVILHFEYSLSEDDLTKLSNNFTQEDDLEDKKAFLEKNYHNYFKYSCKTIFYDREAQQVDESIFKNITKERPLIKKVIQLRAISAKRNVSNKETDKHLSYLSAELYKGFERSDEEVEQFEKSLMEANKSINEAYKRTFKDTIATVEKFGENHIGIFSSLETTNILEKNSTVRYEHSENSFLPESYNGLGHMNLISIIFEILIALNSLKDEKENSADINLLFIEEPEAHTHPQMQYIFIENIKKTLEEKGVNLQTIMTTHSPHIVSRSDFNDIKYLKKEGSNIVAKNLKELEKSLEGQGEIFKFLKQYLTVHRAEIFFTDKVIFVEGDTERILLPAMMKKIKDSSENPLLSQNISIIEVGNYSHKFEAFIDFIGVKSLIITDIDTIVEDGGKSCPVAEGKKSSNPSLKFFYREMEFGQLKALPLEKRILLKKEQEWKQGKGGHVLCMFQMEEDNYYPRSFEDAFIHENKDFIKNNFEHFVSIKKSYREENKLNNSYDFATKGISKKPSFAMEILLASDQDFTNWHVPKYIEEGLKWLQKD